MSAFRIFQIRNALLTLGLSLLLSGGLFAQVISNTVVLTGNTLNFTNATVLTNGSILGYGNINQGSSSINPFTNYGIIDANVNARTLYASFEGVNINNGVIEASGGGLLVFSVYSSMTQGNNGQIVADGGTIGLYGSTYGCPIISGGTLNSSNGGSFTVSGGGYNYGTLYATTLSKLTVNAAIYNGGYLNLSNVVVWTNGIITNAGTIMASGITNNGVITNGGGVLQFDHTAIGAQGIIEGYGYIGSTYNTNYNNPNYFTNYGVINANASGQTMFLSNTINNGVIEATGGGGLIYSGSLPQSSKGQIVANGGTVQLISGVKIKGGAIVVNSGSFVDNSGLAFTNSIQAHLSLSGSGTLYKSYAAGSSVAGFGASIGNGVSFRLLAGFVTNDSTLSAQIAATNGLNAALDFKGTYGNAVVLAFSGTTNSTIQWWDTNVATPFWTNTIFGNSTNVIKSGYQGFAGSFSTFLLSNSISTNTTTWVSGILGAYGYDTASQTAWAVIDHNSYFDAGDGTLPNLSNLSGENLPNLTSADLAVQPVPEPSTYALFSLSALILGIITLRRRSAPQLH